MRKGMLNFRVAAALAAVACCLPVGAGEVEPLTPMERMNQAVFHIQQHITASNVKLDQGLASPRVGSKESERPATPGESCCKAHIDRVAKEIRELLEIMDQLDLWYGEQAHVHALEWLAPIHAELVAVSRGMSAFQTVSSKPRAKEALQGLIRPFNRLRKNVEGLEACCPLEKTADGGWKAQAP